MNKTLGLSMGKIANLFGTLWKLDVTPGGVCHAIQSIGRRCQTDYQSILDAVRVAEHVTCDETGWRIGGLGAWLHAAATPNLCAYLIDSARGADATDQLIGEDFSGTLVHDGWRPYDRYSRAKHQQCNNHLLRRCDEMIEAATPGAARFPATIKSILKRGLLLRDQRDANERSLRSTRIHATKLTGLIGDRCKARKHNRANERLAAFLYRHAGQLFTYLRDIRRRCHQLARRARHAVRGGQPQGMGRQPHPSRSERAGDPDERVAKPEAQQTRRDRLAVEKAHPSEPADAHLKKRGRRYSITTDDIHITRTICRYSLDI